MNLDPPSTREDNSKLMFNNSTTIGKSLHLTIKQYKCQGDFLLG